MVRAYEMLSEACDYPLHLGVTEAGPAFQGTIKSAVAFGALLSKGIGDTIRVSLSAPPVEEVKVGLQILESLNLRPRQLEIVSCPSCGRAQVDVYKLADEVTAGLEGLEVPLRVAVMGCVVNGPGEAREADLGVASGNGKGQIFVRGEVIKTVRESEIVETLIEEAMRLAESHAGGRGCARGERALTMVAHPDGADRARWRRLGARAQPGRPAGRHPDAVAAGRWRTCSWPPGSARPGWSRPAWAARSGATSGTACCRALCHAGSNLVPVNADEDAVEAWTEFAGPQRMCASIIGPSTVALDAVAPAGRALGSDLGARRATSGRTSR